MTRVIFDGEDINAKAAAIQSTAGELETLLGQLTSMMASFADTYQGPGANAFQEVYQRWQQDQSRIHADLTDIGTALQNTGTIREDVERQIAGQWASAL